MKYPVDLSYMVCDFKYSQEHGLKICEVQHGALSAFDGDLYISGGDGSILPKVVDFFSLLPMKKWAAGLIYPPFKKSLAVNGWDIQQSMETILKDPAFLKCAEQPPSDPFSIGSYAGIVYATRDVAQHFQRDWKAHPGILFIDAAASSYWRDKYRMNALFERNSELKKYKADWALYPKKYDSLLSERIQREMPSELYVIKPRSEVLANGVIVVESSDLDRVLQMILEPSRSLETHPDQKYSYWFGNKDETFLIEKYYMSDCLHFSNPLSEGGSCRGQCRYDATMRVAFILQYDRGAMICHSLGGYWKLPSKTLEEEGTLNEKRISCCKPPFYSAVDPGLFIEVDAKIKRSMLLLYEAMLNER